MKKATFTVETISAGMGEVLVYVEDPAGHREEVMFSSGFYILPNGKLINSHCKYFFQVFVL